MQSKYTVNQRGDDALIVREDSWFKIHEKMIKIMHFRPKKKRKALLCLQLCPTFLKA